MARQTSSKVTLAPVLLQYRSFFVYCAMASGMSKVGDWQRVRDLTGNLLSEIVRARDLSLKRFGLKAEGLAKEHISKQDLNWQHLAPATLARKVRKGYSENILVETSTYFQNITSWVDKEGEDATVYVGVKTGRTYQDGEDIADIAKLHEYGSVGASIPARPLWTPTFAEALDWHFKNNSPERIFQKNIQRYL